MKNPPAIAPKIAGITRGQTSLKNTIVSSFAQAATICKQIPTAGLMQVLPVILYQLKLTFELKIEQQGLKDIFAMILQHMK